MKTDTTGNIPRNASEKRRIKRVVERPRTKTLQGKEKAKLLSANSALQAEKNMLLFLVQAILEGTCVEMKKETAKATIFPSKLLR